MRALRKYLVDILFPSFFVDNAVILPGIARASDQSVRRVEEPQKAVFLKGILGIPRAGRDHDAIRSVDFGECFLVKVQDLIKGRNLHHVWLYCFDLRGFLRLQATAEKD